MSSGVDDTSLLYNEYPSRVAPGAASGRVRLPSDGLLVILPYTEGAWHPPEQPGVQGAPSRAFCPIGAHTLHSETIASLTHFPSRYIVYDIAQVNLKYLLKLKFNFKTSLW